MHDWYALSDSAFDEDGFLEAAVDAYGESDAKPLPYEVHHLHGFLGRPMPGTIDPDSGEVDAEASAQVYVMSAGDRMHAFVCEDPRVVPNLPAIHPGESIQYGSAWGNFVRCHDDGSVSLVTATKPASDGTGQPLHFWIRPTGLEFVAPWARWVFDQTGWHVYHLPSGAEQHFGSLAGLPAPFDAIKSHYSVRAGIVSHDATAVAAGSSSGTQQAVALAAPVLLVIQELVAAIATAIGGAGTPASAAQAATALTTAAEAILALAPETVASPSFAG